MSQTEQCPLCYTPLEVRDVAPCCDCGAFPDELDHCRAGKHTYAEYEVFPGVRAVFCNFCDVDFGSYDQTFFGLPRGKRVDYGCMQFVRKVAPVIGKDKYCPECRRRLAFLRFVVEAREVNGHAADEGLI